MRSANMIAKLLFSFPRTILFNFRHLPFKQAMCLPIWIAPNCKILLMGGVKCEAYKFASIRIGFHKVPIMEPNTKTVLEIKKGGLLFFKGTAHIGRGTKIHVSYGATLEFGDNFAISASTQINCYKSIRFGSDIQFSWDCLVMDSDTHNIYDKEGKRINEDREIVFGDKIWIGCRSTILKGSKLPSGCVIGACSLVSGRKFEKNTIIAGAPAKSIKKIGSWKL